MAALSAARDTKRSSDSAKPPIEVYPVATNTTIYQGGMVALNSSGYAKAAAAGDTVVVGVAEKTVVNAGADAAVSIAVRRGVFKFANKAGDLVTQADVAGKVAYVENDQTVRHTSTSSILAGVPKVIETDGVWVEIG